jgi:hypothetical protein
MRLTVDFSSVPDFELIPAGVYPVRILTAEVVKSKNNAENYNLNINVEITDGEFTSRRVFCKPFSLSEKAMGFLKRAFDALGIEYTADEPINIETDPDDDEKLARGEAVPLMDPDLTDLEGFANVIINKYTDQAGNKKENNQVDKFVAEPTEAE